MVPIDPVAKKMESPFLQGGGEMGRLIRAFDWSATPIGDPDQWPMCLKSTVSTILHSRHPMFLWWGAGLIQFYNDAYRPSMGNRGKHPGALGNKGKDTWPEIWTTIKPLIDSVLSGKEATWNEDQLIPIYRNGRLEEVYWTFGYSPVYNDSGKIEGVLVVCTETTAKVLNFRANKSSKEDLSFAIDAGQLGTWDLDPRTMRLGGNARLKLWFGLPDSDELLLDQALAVIHPKQRNKVMEAIQYALTPESGGLYDIEYTIINFITKEEKTVRATGKAIFDENKLAIRFSGIVQDMTERKELELLESKNRELQRSNANLEEFTHIASHDLKEPMRKISFFTDRLKTQLGGRLTEEDKTTL